MSTLSAGLILTAVRNALESASGVSRTITANTYEGDAYESLSDEEKSRRGAVRARMEPVIRSLTPHSLAPPRNGSVGIYEMELDVMVWRHTDSSEKLVDATRDTAASAAINDGDVIAQCLEFPGNVNVNSSGTRLIGSCLTYAGTEIESIALADDGPGLITARHKFRGFIQVTM